MNAETDMRPTRGGGRLLARRRSMLAAVPKDLALDLFERAFVVALFVVFADRMLGRLATLIALQIEHPELIVAAATMNIGAILLVLSESLGVFLILVRRRTPTLSSHPLDWALSFAAVNAPLLTVPAAASTFVPPHVASALMFAGLVIQISAKATLWRSFGIVPANRGIKTVGIYRLVRHPVYAGYSVTHIGFLIGFPNVWNAFLYVAVMAVQIARIMREERLLADDPVYRAYMQRVRYRLLPGIF